MKQRNSVPSENKYYQNFCSPAQIERDFQTIIGILEGVHADGEINAEEILSIHKWLMATKSYENREPYKTLINKLSVAISDYYIDNDEKEDIIWFCNHYIQTNDYYNIITSGIQRLSGILHGLIADNAINDLELKFLSSWLEDNQYLKNSYPYDDLCQLVTSVINNDFLTGDELALIYQYCDAFSDKTISSNDSLIKTIKLGECLGEVTKIEIDGSSFCITGESKRFSRREIANSIELQGGIVKNTVGKNLTYLVVCAEKNSCWAFAAYGRKIEQVINLNRAGQDIKIIHEEDLYKILVTV